MSNLTVKVLGEEDYLKWDKFVEESENGSIFNKTFWAENIIKNTNNLFSIYCVVNNNDEIKAGVLICHFKKGIFKIAMYPPVTPFMNILFSKKETSNLSKIESNEKNIISILSDRIINDFSYISLALDPSIRDVRPFKWEDWDIDVAYTYYVDLSNMDLFKDNLGKSVKYDIKKAEESNLEFSESENLEDFFSLYEMTFSRQNIKAPVSKDFIMSLYKSLKNQNSVKLYEIKKDSKMIASAFVIFDKNKAYYLMAASDPDFRKEKAPTLLLWKILLEVSKTHKEIDLAGANTPIIIKFKRDFASKLVPYFIVSKIPSRLKKLAYNVLKAIKK